MSHAVTQVTPVAVSPLTAATLPAVPAAAPVYQNPIPVVAVIVPVLGIDPATGREAIGVLTVRRGIEPMLGKLALPGGYMGYETWASAGAREIAEETGLKVNPDSLSLANVHSGRENTRLIVFGRLERPIDGVALAGFRPNEEVSELVVVFAPAELAFSTHTEELKAFFERGTAAAMLQGTRCFANSPEY
jgi:ADP-ribose pyrophosphatase YjhB (NUDIX family)